MAAGQRRASVSTTRVVLATEPTLMVSCIRSVPRFLNIRNPVEEYQLDLVRDEPREGRIRAALVLSRGRGGFNSAIVVREYP